MKNERYRGQIPLDQIQRDYFLHFNHNYWMHKANALLNFIEDKPTTIQRLRFEGDRDSDQTILDNLKMELHMMVFHSSETLFLNIFSIVFMPTFPWIWISRCDSNTLTELIKTVGNEGLSAIRQSPEVWLRENLFPSITEKHKNYEKAKCSTVFVVNYLKSLAQEYLDRNEYNSYKHGLRSFPGKGSLQVFSDATSEKVSDMKSDTIKFLEFEKKDKDGKLHIDRDGKPYTRVKLTSKGFDCKRDYGIIKINSAILSNLFYTKSVMIKTALENSRNVGHYLFDNLTVDSIFNYSPEGKGTGVFKKFTI
jgi:hypothetical protein